MTEIGDLSAAEGGERGEDLTRLFDLVAMKYSTALIRHNASNDFRYILVEHGVEDESISADRFSLAHFVLADDVDARHQAETLELMVRIGEDNLESASLWLNPLNDDRFFIVKHYKDQRTRMFKFQNDSITPYMTRRWQGRHWHRSPRSRLYYEGLIGTLEPVPLRERQ